MNCTLLRATHEGYTSVGDCRHCLIHRYLAYSEHFLPGTRCSGCKEESRVLTRPPRCASLPRIKVHRRQDRASRETQPTSGHLPSERQTQRW